MKRIVETTDASGLEALLGEKVWLICARYFYIGTLSAVNDSVIELSNAIVVYDTDKNHQPSNTGDLPSKTWYIQKGAIESFGRTK